jgi:hypothetical protein
MKKRRICHDPMVSVRLPAARLKQVDKITAALSCDAPGHRLAAHFASLSGKRPGLTNALMGPMTGSMAARRLNSRLLCGVRRRFWPLAWTLNL